MLGATGAAIHDSARLNSMSDYAAFTMTAPRGKSMNRAFKRIEVMGNTVHQYFQGFIVLVAAYLTGLDAGVKLVFRLSREVWL
jgi:hypothetical protein